MEAESLLLFLPDPGRRAYYGEALSRAGFRVMHAPTAAVALTRCNREQPSVIVTDVVVPGMHGTDIARALRACARPSREPFIVGLVDSCFDAALDTAEALLFDRLLNEPVSGDVLVRDIRDGREPRARRHRWARHDSRLRLA
jgi:CheY-like chemotaxis protein